MEKSIRQKVEEKTFADCVHDHEAAVFHLDPRNPEDVQAFFEQGDDLTTECTAKCRFARSGKATCDHTLIQKRVHGVHWYDDIRSGIRAIDDNLLDKVGKWHLSQELTFISDCNHAIDRIKAMASPMWRHLYPITNVTNPGYEFMDNICPVISRLSVTDPIQQVLTSLLALIGVSPDGSHWKSVETHYVNYAELDGWIWILKQQYLKPRFEALKAEILNYLPA